MYKKYILECLKESLDYIGIRAALTSEECEIIAKDLEVSLENFSLSHPTPPNPLKAELEKIKRHKEDELRYLEERHLKEVEDLQYTIDRLLNRIDGLEWDMRGR